MLTVHSSTAAEARACASHQVRVRPEAPRRRGRRGAEALLSDRGARREARLSASARLGQPCWCGLAGRRAGGGSHAVRGHCGHGDGRGSLARSPSESRSLAVSPGNDDPPSSDSDDHRVNPVCLSGSTGIRLGSPAVSGLTGAGQPGLGPSQ